MVFNVVKILEIEAGAELDHTVYDQWVRIAYKDHSLTLFDMDMVTPEEAVGDHHNLKIGVMFTELKADVDGPQMAKGNRFSGKVIDVAEEDGLFEHIVDLDGLRVILSGHEEHKVGTMLRFKVRLNLLEFRGSTVGWNNM